MRFKHRKGRTGGRVSVPGSLYDEAPVDGDGYFDVPETKPDACVALARAGHTPVDGDGEAIPQDELEGALADAVAKAGVDEAVSEARRDAAREAEESNEDETDDELEDMSREELYSRYKNEGGPDSWNETDSEAMREWLRENGGD